MTRRAFSPTPLTLHFILLIRWCARNQRQLHTRLTKAIASSNSSLRLKQQALKLSEETAAAEESSRRRARAACSRGAKEARIEEEDQEGICSMGSAQEVPAERGGGGEGKADHHTGRMLNGSRSHRDHIDCDAIDSSLEEVSAGDESAKSRENGSKGGDYMELEQEFFEAQPTQKT